MINIWKDLYHRILTISWKAFLFDTFIFYIGINTLFASIYFLIGPDAFNGMQSHNPLVFFTDCFFFSVQTFSTIGYGVISPKSISANIVVSLQALTGMLSIGLISGLFFSRFSRPSAKVLYSDFVLMTQYQGQKCLVFRVANSRGNQILDAKIAVHCIYETTTPEGHVMNLLTDLKLQRSSTPVFAYSFTGSHIIDDTSPLFSLNENDFKSRFTHKKLRFIITVSGHDETFNQSVFSRKLYDMNQIVFDRFFADMTTINEKNEVQVDLTKISELK